MIKNNKILNLIWTNYDLTIIGPPFPELEKELSYWHRSLEQQGFKRVSKGRIVKLYNEISNIGGIKTIITFQGFLDVVVKLAVLYDYKVNLIDQRLKFPKPKYDLMFGFRFSQEDLLKQFLNENQSGILTAPTRYGKTALLVNTMRAFPELKTVLAAPGVDLLGQLVEELKEKLPGREIVGLFTGSKAKNQSDDITVCSFDSLYKCDFEGTDLLLVDEIHAAVTESRAPLINKFTKARRLGFSATIEGRYDGADKLITGIFGPVLSEKTYLEAVEEGAICPIKVYMIRIPFEHFDVSTRNSAYTRLLYKNKHFVQLVKELCDNIIPEDWQSLIFINQEKHANIFEKAITNATIAMQKKMKNKNERNELFQKMKNNEIKRCVCSNIYSTGVTFSELRTIVNCAGGGGSINSIQKPGRLAEIRPNKKCGYVFDFLFECSTDKQDLNEIDDDVKEWRFVVNDSKSRLKVYRDKGYNIEIIDNLNEIRIK